MLDCARSETGRDGVEGFAPFLIDLPSSLIGAPENTVRDEFGRRRRATCGSGASDAWKSWMSKREEGDEGREDIAGDKDNFELLPVGRIKDRAYIRSSRVSVLECQWLQTKLIKRMINISSWPIAVRGKQRESERYWHWMKPGPLLSALQTHPPNALTESETEPTARATSASGPGAKPFSGPRLVAHHHHRHHHHNHITL